MTIHSSPGRIAAYTIIGVLLLIVVGALAASFVSPGSDSTNTIDESGRVTLTGDTTCLPHKDRDGPTTLECAIGLETDDGSFYGLDLSAASMMFGLDTGMRITVEGRLVPVADLDIEERMRIYDIVGIVRVVSIVDENSEDRQ